MSKVDTSVVESDLDGDYGDVPGLIVTCERCGHSVEVFGIEEPSKRRAGAMLNDECPKGENNYYDVD